MHFIRSDGEQIAGSLYGKVLGPPSGTSSGALIRFTSISPEINAFLRPLIDKETTHGIHKSAVRTFRPNLR